jgi:methyltransferase (TIGR00027 family)
MLVEDISDTARWIALYRAQESDRPDALFHDPLARRLAGESNADIARLQERGRGMDWSMAVRTRVIDDMILEVVRAHEVDTVLMLAAGLDTRPYRLALPAELAWHEVDLPALLARKEELLRDEKPACRVTREAVDLTDASARRALLARVAGASKRALVVTEGLLVYLPSEVVGALAVDLAAHPAFGWWITDLVSPLLLRMILKSGAKGTGARPSAADYFGPREGTAFFAPLGFREAEYHSSLTDSVRLRRAPVSVRVMLGASRVLPRRLGIDRIAGNVLLERR